MKSNLLSTTLAAALIFCGCSGGPSSSPTVDQRGGGTDQVVDSPQGGTTVNTSAQYGGRYNPHGDSKQAEHGNTPEGVKFAEYVIGTDPEHKFVKDAFVRDNQVLGVIVSPTMTRGQVEQSLTSLMKGMVQRFNNYPLQVIAYYESGDEMAKSTYDGRNTSTDWKK